MKGIRFELEGSIASVDKEQGSAGTHYDQILMSVIIQVCKQRTRSGIQDADASLVGHILKRAVAAVSIEAVRQPGRLADIDIIPTITIKVASRDSVVPVDINAAGSIEYSAPMI
ncbi:MAG: hypothetical protein WBQ06_14980 [Acidobacteriaceae bacterium]